MNFALAKQNTGTRTQINAKVIKVWPETVVGNNKRKQRVDVTDGFVTVEVTNWLRDNFPAMTEQEYNGRESQWLVSHSVYNGKDQYSGWITNTPNTQPLNSQQPAYQPAPANAAQPAPVAPQSTKAVDEVQLYIIRQSSLKAAVESMGAGCDIGAYLDRTEVFVNYVLEGLSRSIADLGAREGDRF